MKLQYPKVYGDGLVFREDFTSWQHVADNGGVVVSGAPFLTGDGVVETVSGTSNIRHLQTRNMFPYSQAAMTLVVDFTTPSSDPASWNVLVQKGVLTVSAQFVLTQYGGQDLRCFIMNAPADFANRGRVDGLSASTRYHFAWVYNGAGAGNSTRLVAYKNGVVDASIGYAGTIPAQIIPLAAPLEIFGTFDVATTVVHRVRIFDRAFSADEALDYYQRDTYGEVEPGP